MTGVQSAGHDVLGGIGVDGDGGAADGPPQLPSGETLPGPPPRLTVADKERLIREQKKAVKKAHKAAKKVSCSVCPVCPAQYLRENLYCLACHCEGATSFSYTYIGHFDGNGGLIAAYCCIVQTVAWHSFQQQYVRMQQHLLRPLALC